MSKPLVAVLDVMPQRSRDVISSIFDGDFEVRFAEEGTQHLAEDATVLLTMWGSVDAATIASARSCRLIQKLGVGTDKIDVEEARRRGVTVLKAAGINAEAVAELTILLMMAVGRQLPDALVASRSGTVQKEELRARSLQLLGRRVGLLGMGHIGLAVAKRLAGFGVELAYYDLRRLPSDVERSHGLQYLEIDDLVASVDVLSLHLPKTPETDRIVGPDLLAKVRPGLILVNTARGSLVDEGALLEAIADGRIMGAGLDVSAQEPLPSDSPLLACDRVILTPHVGGAVSNNFPRVVAHAHSNALAVLAGRAVPPADVVFRSDA